MRAAIAAFAISLAAASSGLASEPFTRTELRARCQEYTPLKRPLFGDLHVHTTLSFDAWGQGTRNRPSDAYRFAKGEPLGIQPYGEDGEPIRSVQLAAPLDFAMVSDHSEMLGETELCRAPGSPAYDTISCGLVRRWPLLGYAILNSQWGKRVGRSADICGDDEKLCADAASGPWREIQEAAEAHYDRSPACRFTTFVGYEWSGGRTGMIHRNVMFRNSIVPRRPNNAIDDRHDETKLWRDLRRDCIDAAGFCDVLAIPHNSNVSRGDMFWTRNPVTGEAATKAENEARARMEPVVEITQHKGDSECRAHARDEFCAFETVPFADIAGHAAPWMSAAPPANVYVREALQAGLEEDARTGANPFRYGIIGSTDTHFGTPGLVSERGFAGHAAGAVTARLEVPPMPDHPSWNPGGLTAVWAEENSRDAIFEAIARREVYGTSGPRFTVRFFGGSGLSPTLCEAPDSDNKLVRWGYAQGVPMGGVIEAKPETTGLRFVVAATADPGSGSRRSPGLERVQIVKGWIEDGKRREKVFDAAVSGPEDYAADPNRCEPRPTGAASLCAFWEDPDFDPTQRAFYYARVLEHETCRWTAHACLAADVDCGGILPKTGPTAACCDEGIAKTIHERAWTSPIWYRPQ